MGDASASAEAAWTGASAVDAAGAFVGEGVVSVARVVDASAVDGSLVGAGVTADGG